MAYVEENAAIKKLFPKQKYLNYYLAGFVDGEGCFTICIKKEPTTRFGWAIDPEFRVVQHKKGKDILLALQNTLNCGNIQVKPGQENILELVIKNRRHLTEKVIPFFRRYKLFGKREVFEIFCKVVNLMENKEHSTQEGFIKILDEVFKINQGIRKYSKEEILENLKSPQRLHVEHKP